MGLYSKNKIFFLFFLAQEYYFCTRYVERFEIDCNHSEKMLKQSRFFNDFNPISRSPKFFC